MVTTIMVYKFTQLTRAEVDAMLGVTLQETRIYQEAKAEGKVEGKVEGKAQGKLEMLLMLLNHNFGALPDNLTEQIEMLPIAPLAPKAIEQLESLCTASFDFQKLSDITNWLESLVTA
jgi:predicted transposase YdaD